MIKIATWNINSVIKRTPNIMNFINAEKPDVILLQELKCMNSSFPELIFNDAGYSYQLISGQKAYNGVAILSRYRLNLISQNLLEEDSNARFLDAELIIGNIKIRLISVYVPNGQEIDSEQFKYKMIFFDKLIKYLEEIKHKNVIIGGDFNVATDDIDVHSPKTMSKSTGFSIREREKMFSIRHIGFSDIFRDLNKNKQEFSWWDYRARGWQLNRGMRIDYIFSSPRISDSTIGCNISRLTRGEESPSDHVPVILEFDQEKINQYN